MAKICSYQLATFQHYTYKNNAFSKLALDDGNHASADASATAAIAHPSAPIAGRPGLPCRWRSPRSPLPLAVAPVSVAGGSAGVGGDGDFRPVNWNRYLPATLLPCCVHSLAHSCPLWHTITSIAQYSNYRGSEIINLATSRTTWHSIHSIPLLTLVLNLRKKKKKKKRWCDSHTFDYKFDTFQ